jgi:hypothetical protein
LPPRGAIWSDPDAARLFSVFERGFAMTATTQEWLKDPKGEAVLQQLGIKFHPGVLQLKDVDWKATDENVGRIGRPTAQETVDDYALAIMDGAAFPRPIVTEGKNGTIVLAGVHRAKAAKAARMDEIGVYFTGQLLPEQHRLIAVMTNRKEGVRCTATEALEYAVDMIQRHELDIAEVCKLLGVRENSVRLRLRLRDLRVLAKGAGAKEARVTDTTLKRLTTMSGNAKVLAAACNYIAKHGLLERDAIALAKSVGEKKTEAEMLAVIEVADRERCELAEKIAANGHAKAITFPHRTNFLRALSALRAALGVKTKISDLQIVEDSDEHKRIRQEWAAIKRQLTGILS